MDVARVQAAGVQAGCDTADRGGDTSCVVRTGATTDVLSRRGRHELCCPDGGSRSDDISLSDDVSPTFVLEFETGATLVVLSRRGRHELCCPDGGSTCRWQDYNDTSERSLRKIGAAAKDRGSGERSGQRTGRLDGIHIDGTSRPSQDDDDRDDST
jgi:hypothetical protein